MNFSSSSSKTSVIVATSPRRSSAPLVEASTTRSSSSSTVRRSSVKRTITSPPGVRSVPAGRSMLCWPMTRATSAALTPYCMRATAGTSIRIWWSEKPLMLTIATSGSRSSRTLRSSQWAFRSRRGMSPVTAIEATPSVRPSCRTIGRSARSGRSSMASTSVFTSSKTTWRSAPSTISTVTRAIDSSASELTSLTSSIPSTASSMRRQIASSTSPGAAPGYSTVTWTRRAGMSGKVSRISRPTPDSPTAMMASISRLAAVRWAAKNRIIECRLRPGLRSQRSPGGPGRSRCRAACSRPPEWGPTRSRDRLVRGRSSGRRSRRG